MPFTGLIRNRNPKSLVLAKYITVVSGLPRSGTSLMMSMLQAGGMDILIDNFRVADDNNPHGYFEFERVKKLKEGDVDWVKDARGKAVKIISALLEYLPSQYPYKIIFMRRNMNEILASQKQMLLDRNEVADQVSDEKMAELFSNHLSHVENWISSQPNIDVLHVNYNELLYRPENDIPRLSDFLGRSFDRLSMLEVIDKNLYRQRS